MMGRGAEFGKLHLNSFEWVGWVFPGTEQNASDTPISRYVEVSSHFSYHVYRDAGFLMTRPVSQSGYKMRLPGLYP